MTPSGSPRFSIVIPTRNRAGLLRHALATAMAQTHGDFEVVVSDNASVDDTRSVVTQAGDPRVRYVRSEEPLAQPDSWEFAVGHARGEWITVLGDDDGMAPSLLDRVDAVVVDGSTSVVAWGEAWYTHAELPPPGLKPGEENTLTVEPSSGSIRDVDCREQLARFFSRREVTPVPGLVNSAVSRPALDRIRSRVGRLFPAPDPAVATITALFALVPSYRVIDQPLGVKGLSGATISLGLFHHMREMHESIEEFDTDDLFREAPLQSTTGSNLVAESLLRMKRMLPDELAPYDLDLVRYFVTTRREIGDPRRRPDGGAALAEWRRVLSGQPEKVRTAVRRELGRHWAEASARRLARRVPGLRWLRDRVRRQIRQGSEFLVIDGEKHGFSDLPGAARHLDQHVLPALERA